MFELKQIEVKDVLQIDELTLQAKVISIEGQSGSGKSTLLRLLNHLDNPTSGEVYFKGEKLTGIEPTVLRKRIVMLPQNPIIFEGTIEDNLNIGLKLSNQERAKKEDLKEILELFWIDKELTSNANDLSGGEMQRLSLARILLMKETEVYLLDEPSSDLDEKTTDHIMKSFIKYAQHNHQQVIMVTHDKSVSKRFAEEIIDMNQYSKHMQSEVDMNGK